MNFAPWDERVSPKEDGIMEFVRILSIVQCVHGSTDIVRHTLTPLYNDISKI